MWPSAGMDRSASPLIAPRVFADCTGETVYTDWHNKMVPRPPEAASRQKLRAGQGIRCAVGIRVKRPQCVSLSVRKFLIPAELVCVKEIAYQRNAQVLRGDGCFAITLETRV